MGIKPWPLLSGLSSAADHMTCPPGYLMQMDDWVIEYGRLRPRFGSTILNTVPLNSNFAIDCGIFYKDVASPTHGGVMIVQGNQKIWRSAQYSTDAQFLTNTNVLFTDITGSATPSSSGTAGTADVLNNILILTSITGAPSQVTSDSSTAAPLAGSPPSGIIVKVVNNFAFLSGVVNGGTNASRVWWCNVGDPQTWTAANFLDYRTNDADQVVALGNIGQDLLIFKTNHIARLSTQTLSVSGAVTLGPLTTLFTGIGCAGYRAIDNMQDGRCVFLGSDFSLYLTDGVSLQLLSRGPFGQPDVYRNGFINTSTSGSLDKYALAGLNFGGSPSLVVHSQRGEIWISMPSTLTPTGVIFAYDYIQGYWRRIIGHAIGSFIKFPPIRGGGGSASNQRPFRIFGGTNGNRANANVIALDNELITTPTDDTGATVTANAVFSVSDPELLSDPKTTSLDIPSSNSGSTTVTFGFDGTLNGSSTATLSATTTKNVIRIPYRSPYATVRPSSLQVQLKDTNSSNFIYTPVFSDEVVT